MLWKDQYGGLLVRYGAVMYLKFGFVFCVFMDSEARRRKTHTLPPISMIPSKVSCGHIPRTHHSSIHSQYELLQQQVQATW